MSALGKVVRSGVGQRRLQSLVIALTTFATVTTTVLSLGLLTAVQAPFEHAFSARNGAHLAVQFDSSKVTAAQAAATAHAAGVTEAAGPYPVAAALDTLAELCERAPDAEVVGLVVPTGYSSSDEAVVRRRVVRRRTAGFFASGSGSGSGSSSDSAEPSVSSPSSSSSSSSSSSPGASANRRAASSSE